MWLVAGALLASGAVPASGDPPASVTFSYVGGQQWFVVPPGVCFLDVAAFGGSGGPASTGEPGGLGSAVWARLAVDPHEVLVITVGGQGQPPAGGFGGGGAGGAGADGGVVAGGGGGATTIARQGVEVIVAGGGGGGGAAAADPSAGAGGGGGSGGSLGPTGATLGMAAHPGDGAAFVTTVPCG
ncbi:hypothetical protein GCM10009681_52710 [Luedemannella helvata]|uniref:Secreted protein n=2 Tax=Luedemannella helvata TaxID=349315 RepID=A0ABN2L4F1_9ACTN